MKKRMRQGEEKKCLLSYNYTGVLFKPSANNPRLLIIPYNISDDFRRVKGVLNNKMHSKQSEGEKRAGRLI